MNTTAEPQQKVRKQRKRKMGPYLVDCHVGKRVRLRRTLLGMSQEKLGDAVGVTFQQVQKYERGTNRIGASRLFDLSRVLDVPVSFFFDDLPPEIRLGPLTVSTAVVDMIDPMMRRETLELVRAYYRIPDADVRKRMFDLTKAIAAAFVEVVT